MVLLRSPNKRWQLVRTQHQLIEQVMKYLLVWMKFTPLNRFTFLNYQDYLSRLKVIERIHSKSDDP